MTPAIAKAALAALLASACPFAASAAGVDPVLLALVAPDAKMLAGIAVSQAQSTPIGQALMAQIQLDPAANKAMAEAGFDPRRDLRELAVFGSGARDVPGGAVLLGRGSFHPDKIAAAAVSAGAPVSTYRGVRLIDSKSSGRGGGANSPGNNPAGSLAFLDASTMLAGDTVAVKAAIDRHAAGAAFSGPLAERARQISAANDAWLATLEPPPGSSAAVNLGPFAGVLQSALQLSAGLKLTAAQVTLSAEVLTRSPQDAQALVDVLKFAVGMLQANQPKGPNSSSGASLADAAKISAAGSTLHVVWPVPERQVEQFFLKPPAGQPILKPPAGQPK